MVIAAHVWGHQWYRQHVLFCSNNDSWSTSHFLGLPKYHPSCICYVPCYLQLPPIVSLPNIILFQESLIQLVTLFPAFIARIFILWSPKLILIPPLFHHSCWRTSSLHFRSTVLFLFGSGPSSIYSQILCYSSVPVYFLLRQLGRIHLYGSPCTADEWTLCLFATFLVRSLQHASIKVYFSSVRALHIEQGFADPLQNCPRLQRVIHGIKCSQGTPSSSHLPITNDLMLVIWKSLDLQLHDHCMF